MTAEVHRTHHERRRRLLLPFLAVTLLAGLFTLAAPPEEAEAGIFFNDTEFTYKEYWASHASYTGHCNDQQGNASFIEPAQCEKSITLNIPDDISGGIAAVLYLDLWRNRDGRSAIFTINDGPQIRPNVGSDFSRTPWQASVPLNRFVKGQNVIKFKEAVGAYHVKDVMLRVYYDEDNPLVPGPNSDVTAPSGQLLSISAGADTFDPAVGGVLSVDSNQVTLTATASGGVSYVEFHAFYDGYDEDNDGETRDWHSFLRNNWGPGGTEQKSTGATIGHLGTDATSPYSTTWNLPTVPNQEGVKFKIRVVDAQGNVREAAGGVSAEFDLQRSYSVEAYRVSTAMHDKPLYFDGQFGQLAEYYIDLPDDLAAIDEAYLLGNYWNNPNISINANPSFPAFVGQEDQWITSKRTLDVSQLKPGRNRIDYSFAPPSFGAMIEKPGPMIVIHRPAPAGVPVITRQPNDAISEVGKTATFYAAASGQALLSYQWRKNGVPIPGATSPEYTTGALRATDDQAEFSVAVTNSLGTAVSEAARLTVAAPVADDAPWWDETWDFRIPVSVSPEGVARTDKIAEVFVNFSARMRDAGSGGPTFDPGSIRVIEVDAAGTILDLLSPDVPSQFDAGPNYNAISNASGTVSFQMTGATGPGQVRYFHIYWDRTSKNIPAASYAPQVELEDGVFHKGNAAYRLTTQAGEWWFHKNGGGFGSLIDLDGNDWIDWSTLDDTAGDFRGIPNSTKPPRSLFHPGRNKNNTRIVSTGPLKLSIRTSSSDNAWIAVWDIYPTYSSYTMFRAGSEHWFLYEGEAGGQTDLDGNDIVVKSSGEVTPIDGTFAADLSGEEWVYVADQAQNRSLFVAHHQDDGSVDSYRLLNNEMSVVGFGRGGLGLNYPYLARSVNDEPQKFTVGLTESADFPTTAATVRASYQDLNVVVGSPAFNGVFNGAVSDDFSTGTLDPGWTFTDPRGDVPMSFAGGDLILTIPEGDSHDLWTARDFAPRLLQDTFDGDYDFEVKFNSRPASQFQGQGLLFVQDANNMLRYSVEHDGTRVRLVSSVIRNGIAEQIQKKTLKGVAPRHLRVIRTGDKWSMQRSYNGTRWYGFKFPFTHAMTVNQVGVFAFNHPPDAISPAPGFTVNVDYFQNRGLPPIQDDAPRISNLLVDRTARSAVVRWTTSVPASTELEHGPTIDLGQRERDDALVTEHAVPLDFLDCGQDYFFRPTSSSVEGTVTGSMGSFTTEPCPTVFSDSFSTSELDPRWTYVDPAGGAELALTGTNALISIPANNDHNLFVDANSAARLRQDGPAGDFEVEAKFQSVKHARFQMEGIVVEEADDSFVRAEIHHDGSGLRAYVVNVRGEQVITHHAGALPGGNDQFLRVGRAGNVWTVQHSTDGAAWTTLTTFVLSMQTRFVGPYIGTTSTGGNAPPSFVGSIDYFFNTASPIIDEDGGANADTTPPTFANIVAGTDPADGQKVLVTWDTNEPATTRIEWGTTTALGTGPVIDNTALRQHSISIGPLNCGTRYYFQVSAHDSAGNKGTSARQSIVTEACPSDIVSDDFSSSTLDSRWTLVDNVGDSTVGVDRGLLSMAVPSGSRHDLNRTNTDAVRLLQAVPNIDFEVEVRFESTVNFASQIQGLALEADASSIIRFDLSSDGENTFAFVGSRQNNGLSALAYTQVDGNSPGTLRVSRTGTAWSFDYSADGQTFQTIYAASFNFNVARMGPFVGNANPRLRSTPPHTALIDYFFNTAAPVVPEDGGLVDGPQIDVWKGLTQEFGTPSMVQADVNILGRVTDPDGVASMTYQVNGRDPVAMGIGDNQRRLANDGDWNAAIPTSVLNVGANTVVLRAIDSLTNATTETVTVNYNPSGSAVAIPYSIDWSTVSDINEVGQVVDGRWELEGDSVRVTEYGYDRLLGVGDASWSTFEATVPITINAVDPRHTRTNSGGAGVGFIPHWNGHVGADFTQPAYGFSERLGALIWYRYRDDINGERLEIRDSNANLVAEDLHGKRLTKGLTYMFKMSAETSATEGPTYRLKVWLASETEPARWDLVTKLPDTNVDSGSLLLVAHHVDANFGDLTVRKVDSIQPNIRPDGGLFEGLVRVEMDTPTPNGEMHYTLDGSDPTQDSPRYTTPFFLTESATVRAKTFRAGFEASSISEASFDIVQPPDRIEAGLTNLYSFDEGSGTTIRDTGPAGQGLDLDVTSGSVEWLGNGGIRIAEPSIIKSAASASLFNQGVINSQTMTIEAWIDPATMDQGPASLLAVGPGDNAAQRNLMINQAGFNTDLFLRTTRTDAGGSPNVTAGAVLQDRLQHYVMVRRADNTVTVYIDGEPIWEGTRHGNTSAWAAGYGLAVGNHPAGGSPWLGDMYLMALYNRDLGVEEIDDNYRAGPFPPPTNFAPVVRAGGDITIVENEVAFLEGSAVDDGNPGGQLVVEWTQLSGPTPVTFADPSNPQTSATFGGNGEYVLQLSATDGELADTDTVTVHVIAAGSTAPTPTASPPPGVYAGSVDVTLNSGVPNSTVHYTLDGSEPTQASPVYSDPISLFADTTIKARTYRAGLTESQVFTGTYQVTPGERVTDNLLALYEFNEGLNQKVNDTSGVGGALNLTIAHIVRTTRVPSGLRIDVPTVISSPVGASKIVNPIKDSDELTVELWMHPSDLSQTDKMILGISANNNARSVGFLQEGTVLDAYLRTKDGSSNSKGGPPIAAATLADRMMHVVYTRDAAGAAKVYVDGSLTTQTTTPGLLDNWVSTHRLHLGAEYDQSRGWTGTLYLVAFYNRALTAHEVLTNYAIGDT